MDLALWALTWLSGGTAVGWLLYLGLRRLEDRERE